MRNAQIKSDQLAAFGASSKLNAEWEFILSLIGGRPAQRLLTAHGDISCPATLHG